jgi:hypothetical protein
MSAKFLAIAKPSLRLSLDKLIFQACIAGLDYPMPVFAADQAKAKITCTIHYLWIPAKADFPLCSDSAFCYCKAGFSRQL